MWTPLPLCSVTDEAEALRPLPLLIARRGQEMGYIHAAPPLVMMARKHVIIECGKRGTRKNEVPNHLGVP